MNKKSTFFMLAFALSSGAQASNIKHLCTPAEKVIFTCETGKKVASVCMVGKQGLHSLIQYRFGQIGHMEISIPENPAGPSNAVSYGTLSYSGGGGAYLRFSRGNYRYTAYTGMGKGWDKTGITVERDNKLLANLLCKESDVPNDSFSRLNVPKDNIGFEIP
ncbi:Uncharacterized protein ChrSV_4547 [Chromobacterium vaccinii]|uniref:hypothetical protein n=1 Tax=Chromobacterium phragmitis TaxID=2202141 RepID=UPI0011AEA0BE|nr:hypothetical protein [Chromobacterium phragmitis]QND86772.1 Uncharacterized protein ChrSW_4547 [Chromobacterium vaccinii]QND92003.1 Uncharacterized protein ChrSV_4547 [Chromobacterium vaccinii]